MEVETKQSTFDLSRMPGGEVLLSHRKDELNKAISRINHVF